MGSTSSALCFWMTNIGASETPMLPAGSGV